jgi:hypothetical protein
VTTIRGELVIDRPVEEVFDVIADERHVHDPEITHVELLTDEPVRLGTRFRTESVTWGRRTEMVVEITRYDRPHRLASSTRTSGIDIGSELVLERVHGGTGTRLSWTSQLHPHGLLTVLTPVIATVGRRRATAIWANLRRSLEEGQP